MIRKSTEILISGGGIAGLTSACAFAKAGFNVVCLDPLLPATNSDDINADLRSTAFLQPAKNTLEKTGVWESFKKYSTPLEVMRLADAGGIENEIRTVADFNSSEISDQPFAWNLPNWLLKRELIKHINSLPNIKLLFGQKIGRITTRTSENLVIVGNEQYSGPFTTVPLPDQNGRHMSSIIWMEKSPRANALYNMEDKDFNKELNDRSCNILGEIKLASRKNIWPITSQKSETIYGQRFALIAEAAHVIPPIGAQGLNMSLKDIDTLLDLSKSHELGSPQHLKAYSSARKRGVDALNRAAMTEDHNLRTLRLKALKTLHGLSPVRKTLMKKGLGT